MLLMSGKEVSQSIREKLALECKEFVSTYGYAPTLAVVLVGEDPASQTYVSAKKQACDELGYGHRDFVLPASTTQRELMEVVRQLNEEPTVHGILVQLPLPKGLDEEQVIEAIDPAKDVDGFHPQNVGRLLIGKDCFISCTPKGVLAMLDYYGIETDGKDVCIVGRSNIVGKPMAALLMQRGRDATVTVCNTHTKDLAGHVRRADIIIAAAGHPHTVTADMVKDGAVVVDVGTNRVEDATKKKGWRLVGDVDFDAVSQKCRAISPVPGGVGPMTIMMLMGNTMLAARRQAGERV
ncbi:MAG: bifunctional 5,10-methylenetetrahydrofolate dehydrogenase/5,10-methenyltetrahydrofolate cyclohydrolase [Sphaerochaetaceae bacterium]|nr:bifunctional 5,10-methylenetetrahydrofolate dehydrogenase/5,10-methenyltetrahydrofolate cyclohydrolase [Sphaerochaetaceae bacterium]